MVYANRSRASVKFQVCKWIPAVSANPENLCFRLSDNFVRNQRKNFHGRASKPWLSQRKRGDKTLCLLAKILSFWLSIVTPRYCGRLKVSEICDYIPVSAAMYSTALSKLARALRVHLTCINSPLAKFFCHISGGGYFTSLHFLNAIHDFLNKPFLIFKNILNYGPRYSLPANY